MLRALSEVFIQCCRLSTVRLTFRKSFGAEALSPKISLSHILNSLSQSLVRKLPIHNLDAGAFTDSFASFLSYGSQKIQKIQLSNLLSVKDRCGIEFVAFNVWIVCFVKKLPYSKREYIETATKSVAKSDEDLVDQQSVQFRSISTVNPLCFIASIPHTLSVHASLKFLTLIFHHYSGSQPHDRYSQIVEYTLFMIFSVSLPRRKVMEFAFFVRTLSKIEELELINVGDEFDFGEVSKRTVRIDELPLKGANWNCVLLAILKCLSVKSVKYVPSRYLSTPSIPATTTTTKTEPTVNKRPVSNTARPRPTSAFIPKNSFTLANDSNAANSKSISLNRSNTTKSTVSTSKTEQFDNKKLYSPKRNSFSGGLSPSPVKKSPDHSSAGLNSVERTKSVRSRRESSSSTASLENRGDVSPKYYNRIKTPASSPENKARSNLDLKGRNVDNDPKTYEETLPAAIPMIAHVKKPVNSEKSENDALIAQARILQLQYIRVKAKESFLKREQSAAKQIETVYSTLVEKKDQLHALQKELEILKHAQDLMPQLLKQYEILEKVVESLDKFGGDFKKFSKTLNSSISRLPIKHAFVSDQELFHFEVVAVKAEIQKLLGQLSSDDDIQHFVNLSRQLQECSVKQVNEYKLCGRLMNALESVKTVLKSLELSEKQRGYEKLALTVIDPFEE
ncbi:hypothetical protein HK098_002939 [Nowakowskiella sp. JEL0407]|nr:hypothetical protein HK098_002939 [Nowakowskiella sp. JEL0407]